MREDCLNRSGRFSFAVYALLLVATACTASRIDPGADVSIVGSVLAQNGSPAPGARVVLGREADLAEVFFTGVFIGLPCLDNDPPPICKSSQVSKAGSDGRFDFEVKGEQTQGFFGTAATLNLSTRLSRGTGEFEGPAITTRFQAQATGLEVGLRLWQPKVEFSGDFATARAVWSELPSGVLPGEANLGNVVTTLRFQKPGGEPVWVFLNSQSGENFDARLLEDSAGDVAVYALADDIKVDAARGSDLEILLRSARVPFAGGAGKPASRGKPCFVYNSGGSPVAQSPCRLTDGEFAAQFNPQPDPPCPAGQQCPPPAQNRQAYVDLGAPVNVNLVAIRGCPGRCNVETSDDGRTFRNAAVGQAPEDFAAGGDVAVAFPRQISARFVRVSSDGDLASVREVSVWLPAAPPPEPPPAVPSTEGLPTQEADVDDDGLPLVWIAAALLAIVAIILIVVIRRRKKVA